MGLFRYGGGCGCCGCTVFNDAFQCSPANPLENYQQNPEDSWSLIPDPNYSGQQHTWEWYAYSSRWILINETCTCTESLVSPDYDGTAGQRVTLDCALMPKRLQTSTSDTFLLRGGADGNIQMSVKVVSSNAGDDVRLIFDYLDDENYHYGRVAFPLTGSSQTGGIWKVTAGVHELLTHEYFVSSPYTNQTMNVCVEDAPPATPDDDLKLVTLNNQIACYTYLHGGSTVGLATGTLAGTVVFDDFTLTRSDSNTCYTCPDVWAVSSCCVPDSVDGDIVSGTIWDLMMETTGTETTYMEINGSCELNFVLFDQIVAMGLRLRGECTEQMTISIMRDGEWEKPIIANLGSWTNKDQVDAGYFIVALTLTKQHIFDDRKIKVKLSTTGTIKLWSAMAGMEYPNTTTTTGVCADVTIPALVDAGCQCVFCRWAGGTLTVGGAGGCDAAGTLCNNTAVTWDYTWRPYNSACNYGSWSVKRAGTHARMRIHDNLQTLAVYESYANITGTACSGWSASFDDWSHPVAPDSVYDCTLVGPGAITMYPGNTCDAMPLDCSLGEWFPHFTTCRNSYAPWQLSVVLPSFSGDDDCCENCSSIGGTYILDEQTILGRYYIGVPLGSGISSCNFLQIMAVPGGGNTCFVPSSPPAYWRVTVAIWGCDPSFPDRNWPLSNFVFQGNMPTCDCGFGECFEEVECAFVSSSIRSDVYPGCCYNGACSTGGNVTVTPLFTTLPPSF